MPWVPPPVVVDRQTDHVHHQAVKISWFKQSAVCMFEEDSRILSGCRVRYRWLNSKRCCCCQLVVELMLNHSYVNNLIVVFLGRATPKFSVTWPYLLLLALESASEEQFTGNLRCFICCLVILRLLTRKIDSRPHLLVFYRLDVKLHNLQVDVSQLVEEQSCFL